MIVLSQSMEKFSKEEALLRFKKRMLSFANVPEKEFEHLEHVMHRKYFNKGEVILREGQVCRCYYFIIKGYVRSFSIKDGKEVNVNFYFEDDTACDFASFRNDTPSEFYFVAMEDCVTFYGTKHEAAPVFIGETALQTFLFRFFQDLYLKEEEHSNMYKMLAPEDRYKYMAEHHPQFLQRVPVMHLASYLGMSRETLSRIRKKIA